MTCQFALLHSVLPLFPMPHFHRQNLQRHNSSVVIQHGRFGDGSKPWYLVNIKIAGKWMFIPLKMVCIGIDP